jgi:hypothetical protein
MHLPLYSVDQVAFSPLCSLKQHSDVGTAVLILLLLLLHHLAYSAAGVTGGGQ